MKEILDTKISKRLRTLSSLDDTFVVAAVVLNGTPLTVREFRRLAVQSSL